jgi:hypothetical protein
VTVAGVCTPDLGPNALALALALISAISTIVALFLKVQSSTKEVSA